MSNRCRFTLMFGCFVSLLLAGCVSTRQLTIDNPMSASASDGQAVESTKSKQFQPLPGFQTIDGDDYYVRLNSEFEFKGDSTLKTGCSTISSSYEKNTLSATLIFSLRNDLLKFKNDAPGFVYQAGNGKCNFKFEAKKLTLTPWMRLDLAKETDVDYSFYSSANNNVDVTSLVRDLTNAGNLLSMTGVGAGVSLMGQFAGQWLKNNQQQTPAPSTETTAAKNSSESHSLPATVGYSAKTGTLNQTNFAVYAVAEGGINLLKSETQALGELKIYPELMVSLLLKNSTNGLPDARDLSLEEISYAPIKTSAGEIKLIQLIEQSQHPAKPNLNPKWEDYQEVVGSCRKLKLVLKDLGFNKFDRNAFLYYFLWQSKDWQNYNVNPQPFLADESKAKAIAAFASKNFTECLSAEDFNVMKAMGLAVNNQSDWKQVSDTITKEEQLFMPLKAIERQLNGVLKNANKLEMQRQLYPLLATATGGDGTVLLQDNLGDFGIEKILAETQPSTKPEDIVSKPIPDQGLIVTAQQVAQVFSSLAIQELSCARPLPTRQSNASINGGIVLFTTKAGSVRSKGAAIEFEFSAGKINRMTLQLPSYRDFAQDLIDHAEVGGCKIDPAFVENTLKPGR